MVVPPHHPKEDEADLHIAQPNQSVNRPGAYA